MTIDTSGSTGRAALDRLAVSQAYLACYLAADVLWRATGLNAAAGPLDRDNPERFGLAPAGKSLTAFFSRLARVRYRLEHDQETRLNDEEAVTWLRQAESFVDRLGQMVKGAVMYR